MSDITGLLESSANAKTAKCVVHFFCLLSLLTARFILSIYLSLLTIQCILDENTTYLLNISLMHYRTEYRHQIQLLSFYQLHCFSHVFFSSNCRTFMIQDHDHFMSSLVVILGKLGIIQLKVISKKNELLKYDSP